jgi:hypothetical protein
MINRLSVRADYAEAFRGGSGTPADFERGFRKKFTEEETELADFTRGGQSSGRNAV